MLAASCRFWIPSRSTLSARPRSDALLTASRRPAFPPPTARLSLLRCRFTLSADLMPGGGRGSEGWAEDLVSSSDGGRRDSDSRPWYIDAGGRAFRGELALAMVLGIVLGEAGANANSSSL